jgi:tetratricopeptide (TPR) repeat protein
MFRFRPLGSLLLLSSLMVALTVPAAAQDAGPSGLRERIAEAYEAGRCQQVVALARQLERLGPQAVDGITHYRWGFCAARLDRGDPIAHYEEAAERLGEAASEGGAGLEEHFYRVNALINLGRAEASVQAAEAAIESWNAGGFTVDEDSPTAWFRLGKLFRDAGQAAGALEPFGRALELAEAGRPLRDAYVERIARGAREAGASELAAKASALLAQRPAEGPADALRVARTRLAANDLDGAQKAFRQARRAGGNLGMIGQYGARAIQRAKRLQRQGLEPIDVLPDGTPLSAVPLERLQRELAQTARVAWEVISRPTIERARKEGPGTRVAAAPETIERMREVRREFVGLLLEALRRGAPIRGWAVQGGYSPLIHHPWINLHHRDAWQQRRKGLLEEQALSPDPDQAR